MEFSYKSKILVYPIIFVLISVLLKFIIGNNEFSFILPFFKFVSLVLIIYLINSDDNFKVSNFLKNNVKYTVVSIFITFLVLLYYFNRINNENITISNRDHIAYILRVFGTGFLEEFFNRVLIFGYVSIVLNEMKKKNIFLKVYLSSLIFGIMHLSNIFANDGDKSSVLVQILFAFIIGILFQSILLNIKNIILLSTLHSLINYVGKFNATFIKAESNVIIESTWLEVFQSVIFLLVIYLIIVLPISYYLLRNNKCTDITENTINE